MAEPAQGTTHEGEGVSKSKKRVLGRKERSTVLAKSRTEKCLLGLAAGGSVTGDLGESDFSGVLGGRLAH